MGGEMEEEKDGEMDGLSLSWPTPRTGSKYYTEWGSCIQVNWKTAKNFVPDGGT